MSVITYKNVTAPNFAAGNLLRTSSLKGITEGFDAVSDALSSMHERKSDNITGQAIGDIMNLTDPRTMAQERQDIMARLDPRYADMAGIAAAGNQQQAHLLDMAQEQFKVDTQQELYNLTRQGKLASIGASNRSGRGGGGGGGANGGGLGNTTEAYARADMAFNALAQNYPGWDKLSSMEQDKVFRTETRGMFGSKVTDGIIDNNLKTRRGFEKDNKKAANAKKAFTSKAIEPPKDLDSPWVSTNFDRDSIMAWKRDDANMRKWFVPGIEREIALNSAYNIGGGWDETDNAYNNTLDRYQNDYLNASAGENDPETIRIKIDRLRNGG